MNEPFPDKLYLFLCKKCLVIKVEATYPIVVPSCSTCKIRMDTFKEYIPRIYTKETAVERPYSQRDSRPIYQTERKNDETSRGFSFKKAISPTD